MATFFGEVNFATSRACEDDDADEYIERFETAIQYNDTQISASESSSLIVSFGPLANEFLQKCVVDADLTNTGEIKFIKFSNFKPEESVDFHPRKLQPSRFFETKNGAMLCLASPDTIPTVANSLAKRILSLVDQSCPVLIFCSYHYSKLCDDSEYDERKQCTTYSVKSSPQLKSAFPPLPQPSTLDSLPAALMTQCLLEERLCIAYATFSETSLTGDVDLIAEQFKPALSLPPFNQTLSINEENFKKRVHSSGRSEMFDRYT